MGFVFSKELQPGELTVADFGEESTPQALPGQERLTALLSAIDGAMIASIGRTAFSLLDNIPKIEKRVLNEGNSRVSREYGPKARRLLIVGPDVVQFEDQPPRQVKLRPAELLGLMVVKRQLLNPDQYLESGFCSDSEARNVRMAALGNGWHSLLPKLVDGRGRPAITQVGSRDQLMLGFTDVLVKDLRHSQAYEVARHQHSLGLFETYIMEGGKAPDYSEIGSFRALRKVLRDLGSDKLAAEQRHRFQELSATTAAMMYSSANTGQPVPDSTRNSRHRALVFDTFGQSGQAQAKCLGSSEKHLFYPPDRVEKIFEKEKREAKAKSLCSVCPVKEPCLERALNAREQIGIWGGLNEKERKKLATNKRRP